MTQVNVVNVADLVNPDTGKTYREENNARVHTIPLNAIVEVMKYTRTSKNLEYGYVLDPNSLRLYVTKYGRDCDGTPLYYLSHLTSFAYERKMKWVSTGTMHIDGFAVTGRIFGPDVDGGYPEESLRVVCLNPEIDDD